MRVALIAGWLYAPTSPLNVAPSVEETNVSVLSSMSATRGFSLARTRREKSGGIVSTPFSSPFAGLSNYTDIFTPGTRSFTAFTNTLIYVVLKVGVLLPLSLGLAIVINQIRHGQRLYVYLVFLPGLCAAASSPL